MRTALKILLILILTASSAAGITRQAKNKWKQVVGPRAVAGSAANAAIGQARNRPHEWGQGVGGFAKRFGSSLGTHIAKGTIQMGVAAAHHENLSFQPSNRHGFWPRTKFAVKSTFVVPRTNRPGKTVALGRISGNLGAGMISRAWQPASSAGIGAGLATGGIGLGADVGAHVAHEFWPRTRTRIARNVTHHTDTISR
jgi:hypothetical protein